MGAEGGEREIKTVRNSVGNFKRISNKSTSRGVKTGFKLGTDVKAEFKLAKKVRGEQMRDTMPCRLIL